VSQPSHEELPVEDPVPGPVAPTRSTLEARADLILARLVARIESIRTRKRRLLDPKEEMRRHRGATAILGASATILLGMSVAAAAHRVSTRKRRARRARWDGWMRLVKHPDHVAAKPPNFLLTLLERATSAAVASTLAHVVRHYVDEVLTDRPDRPAVRLLPAAAPDAPTSHPRPK
jgi:hypothetical protein